MAKDLVLVVEDDPSMEEFYRSFFQKHGDSFNFHLRCSGEEALVFLEKHQVDLLILDWYLPALSGIDVLKRIRANSAKRDILVFMVTGVDAVGPRVLALENEADDYLSKPFVTDELLARMRGLLRRRNVAMIEHRVFCVQDLELDPSSGGVRVAGKSIDLHRKQADILAFFLKRPDMLHKASQIGEAVWGYESNSLLYHMSELRRKLGKKWGNRIETRRGEGYLLNTQIPVPE